MQVQKYMSSAPVTVQADMVYSRAFGVMEEKDLHHLPVVDDGGAVVGILTRRDLQLAAQYFREGPIEVAEVMHRPVLTISPDDSLENAARLMIEHRIGGLPVVDSGNQLVGILTETDMFRALTDLLGATG